MKCLTICQPYAHLIVTPQDELPMTQVQKRVENRTWSTPYRGPMLIHAGKSEKYWNDYYSYLFPKVAWGAIVGRCQLIDCVEVLLDIEKRPVMSDFVRHKYPWLAQHEHTEGPWCWILEKVERFETPIPFAGKQGLFNVDDSIVRGLI